MLKAEQIPQQILIIAPAWVGDMVMAQTLFKYLKHLYPQVQLDVVASKSTVILTTRMPEIREGFALNLGHGELGLKVRYRLANTLKQKHYDWALVLPNSWKSALIPWLARISHRTGFIGEVRYGLLNDPRKLNEQQLPLMVQRFLALAQDKAQQPLSMTTIKPFWPSLHSDTASQQTTLQVLQLQDERPVIALCPGAEYGEAKRWPAEHFAKIAQQKLQEGYAVWIMGGPKDEPIGAEINYLCGQQLLNLCGKTSLLQVIDLLALSQVVVTNDSGLMHVACAVNRPVVAVYGSSSPRFTPPLSDFTQILSLKLTCSPCFKRTCPLGHLHCLRELKPDLVLQAISSLGIAT